MINSANKTTEVPLNLTVNTNNKTGYTSTLNSETDETALVNNDSANGAKINSISSTSVLSNFSNNTWGYKFGSSTNYAPIPALSTPAQVLQTAGKTNGNETNSIKIGMKLSDNLESGRYTNKLVFSIVTNNYEYIALMTEGPDFNAKLKALETWYDKIERFKKSTVAPAASMNAVNIEDEESDYEIKLWLDPIDKTAYYYAETEKVYLNKDARSMFYWMSNLTSLDLSNFDTSQVTDMSDMFDGLIKLTTLGLSNFNTSKVTNMHGMFSRMNNLTTLDLSSFDTSQVTDMSSMFSLWDENILIDKLKTIYVINDFDTANLTNFKNIFYNRNTLRGGNGSFLTDPSTADKSWLRIDDPTNGRPGYFTRKP